MSPHGSRVVAIGLGPFQRDASGGGLMLLLLAANVVGGGITFAALWSHGVLIAITSAPLGASLLTALAAVFLAAGRSSSPHGRASALSNHKLQQCGSS